jgi:hypothetical protein
VHSLTGPAYTSLPGRHCEEELNVLSSSIAFVLWKQMEYSCRNPLADEEVSDVKQLVIGPSVVTHHRSRSKN